VHKLYNVCGGRRLGGGPKGGMLTSNMGGSVVTVRQGYIRAIDTERTAQQEDAWWEDTDAMDNILS
jgi:hypothetical protein